VDLKRLTVNAGLRWEAVNAEVPAQTSRRVASWTPGSLLPHQNVPNWRARRRGWRRVRSVREREDAIKFSLNRYNSSRTDRGRELRSPTIQSDRCASFTLPWTDLNRDDIARRTWLCLISPRGARSTSPPCRRISAAGADDVRPEHAAHLNLESGVEVQHALLPRVSVTASWYRGNFHNELVYDNQLVTLADWTPVSISIPSTASR